MGYSVTQWLAAVAFGVVVKPRPALFPGCVTTRIFNYKSMLVHCSNIPTNRYQTFSSCAPNGNSGFNEKIKE